MTLKEFLKNPVFFFFSFLFCTVQEKVDALNEKLDLVLSGGEKLLDGELTAEGAVGKLGYAKKQCG